jgi:hypothetical protein
MTPPYTHPPPRRPCLTSLGRGRPLSAARRSASRAGPGSSPTPSAAATTSSAWSTSPGRSSTAAASVSTYSCACSRWGLSLLLQGCTCTHHACNSSGHRPSSTTPPPLTFLQAQPRHALVQAQRSLRVHGGSCWQRSRGVGTTTTCGCCGRGGQGRGAQRGRQVLCHKHGGFGRLFCFCGCCQGDQVQWGGGRTQLRREGRGGRGQQAS